MALPATLVAGRSVGSTDVVSTIDNNLTTVETEIADILGVTLGTDVAAAGSFFLNNANVPSGNVVTVPMARLTLANNLTMGAAGLEYIFWDTVSYDNDDIAESPVATNLPLKVTRAGVYLVSLHVWTETGSSGGHKLAIQKNADGPPFIAYSSDAKAGSQWNGISLTVPINLAAGDALGSILYNPNASTLVMAGKSSFSIVRLGA